MLDVFGSAERNDIPPIVLVVEDDRDTRDMYEALLNAEGFWVMKVGDALEAFEYAKVFQPDAVLTDLGLPGDVDGAELIRDLRADPTFQFTPIIAVTGRQPRELPSLRGLEISAVLLKPVSPGALIERLSSAITRSVVLRARSTAALEKVPVLLQRSRAATHRSEQLRAEDLRQKDRPCPSCSEPLTWSETSRLNGIKYDYYEWCPRGCGLFCFNRSTDAFEKLNGQAGNSASRSPRED